MQTRLDSLFDIEASRLSPVLEVVTATAGVEFLGFSGQEVDGKPDTLLCDFNYRTPDGLMGETKLFVKRCVWGGIAESVHYHYLALHGVSVPRLYGSLRGTDGLEIIFVEPLTATDFHQNDEAEWRCLLSLLARFNACPITPEYAIHLRGYDQIGQIGGDLWMSALPAFPADKEIAASLRATGVKRRRFRVCESQVLTLGAGFQKTNQQLLSVLAVPLLPMPTAAYFAAE